jgi:hypothetical protein
MQKTEQKAVLHGRAGFAVGLIGGEILGWIIVGAISGLFFLATYYSGFTGVTAVLCGALILLFAAWRAFKGDAKALDDPDDASEAADK